MFTRGGAAKRIFKPTIPTTRRSTRSGEKDGDQNNSCNTSTPHGKVKSKDKERPNKSKGKKELIQLDATFNGINIAASNVKAERGSFVNSGSSNINHLKDRAIKSEDSGVKSINGIRIKSEDDSVPNGHLANAEDVKEIKKHENDDVETIQRALYRDDFVSNYSTNDDELAPIGWENVSQLQLYKHKDCEKDVKPSTRFDDWASTKSHQDKMVLFQLPEMVLKGGDGRLGKIRVFKSGKMELVDTRSGIVYDLLHTDCDVNHQIAGKDDGNSSEEETDNDEVMKDLNEKQKSSSTDWIKKEVEEESANNQDFLPPLPSSSKSQSIHSKNMHKNYRDKCDKDEDTEDDDDDDDDDDDKEMNQSYREAVTFDGNQLVCLGPISKNDLLIGRPRLDKYFDL